MKIGEYEQMMAWLTRPAQEAKLVDDLEPGSLRDELLKDFDPSQETYEEYLQRKSMRENAATGGRVGYKLGGIIKLYETAKKIYPLLKSGSKEELIKLFNILKKNTVTVKRGESGTAGASSGYSSPDYKGKYYTPEGGGFGNISEDARYYSKLGGPEGKPKVLTAELTPEEIIEGKRLRGLDADDPEIGDIILPQSAENKVKVDYLNTIRARIEKILGMAEGGRVGFYAQGGVIGEGGMFTGEDMGTREGFAKVKDTIGRTYDSDNMGRKPKLEGKVGRIVEYLQDLPDGASFYKPDVAKELNLGLAKDGSVDTSLLTKAINSRDELKNKKFKFLTKTDMTVKKINDFVEIFVQENGRAPTQGEIQKGAKADPTRIRTYIEEGRVKNVADTVFDTQTKAANYILNTKKPTIEGLEKIVGKGKGEKLLSRVYINSLGSLNKKFSNIDEGRSVYGNFDKDQIQVIKNKVRRIPGFNNLYEREITDLIANAYPDPKDAAKKKAALKKVSMFKKFNKEVANKFGFNQVLDHPLSYDFITKTSQGVDASELIRVRPLPERVNTFKSFLEQDLEEISKTLKKGYNQAAYNKYLDAKSIADDLEIPFPKMAKTGTITSPAASKVGTKPLIGDAKQAAVIQNNFRLFVQKVKDDPRMKRLKINLKELTDLAKLPEIDIAKYDNAVKKFISKSGKFGVPLIAGYAGVRGTDFLKKEGIGFDKEFEQTASLSNAPLVEKGLSTGEKVAAGTAAAGTLGTKIGRKALGKVFNVGLGPTGILGLNLALETDPTKTLDRVGLETEAAFAPSLVKGVTSVTDKIKNPLFRKGLETLAGVRIPGLINPAMAMRAARVASPIGIASLAGEALYNYGKFAKDEIAKVKAMTPEERGFYNDLLMDEGGLLD